MEYLEVIGWIFLTGILLISDYPLTVVGYRWYKKSFSQFISYENYELNPMWQKSIQQRDKRMFNIRHILLVCLVCILLLCIWSIVLITEDSFPATIFEWCLGMLFFVPLSLDLQHIVNIVIFRYIDRNRDHKLLTGKINLSYTYSLMQSILSRLQILVLLLFCFLITLSPFIFGGVIGEMILFVQFTLIMRRSRKKKNISPT